MMEEILLHNKLTTMAEDKNKQQEELDDELLDEISGGAWVGDTPPAST